MTAVYRTEPKTITYLSPAEFKFLIHRDPELGYGLRRAAQTDQDHRTLFEQRLEVTSRSVYRWLRWRFDDIDAATLDDCLQAGVVGLWLNYQDDPRTLEQAGKTPRPQSHVSQVSVAQPLSPEQVRPGVAHGEYDLHRPRKRRPAAPVDGTHRG